MTDLIIHPSTKVLLDSLVLRRPQAILLFGETGVGLMAVAKDVAKQYGVKPTIILPEKKEVIDPIDGIISVDMIRDIIESTRTKIKAGRIIIIDDADKMNSQAQNAFLKLLEEPSKDTTFILLSHNQAKLLPTTLSRVQKIKVKNILSEQTNKLMDSLQINDVKKRAQLFFMAGGLPAEIIRLANDDNYFDFRTSMIIDAKTLIQGNNYEKLLIINKYKDSRVLVAKLLEYSLKIISISLLSRPELRPLNLINKILDANDKISANINPRLILTEIFI